MKIINKNISSIDFNKIKNFRCERIIIPKHSLFIFIFGLFVLINSFILSKNLITSYKENAADLHLGKLVIHKQDDVKEEYNDSKNFMLLLKDIEDNLSLKIIGPTFSYSDIFISDGTGYININTKKNINSSESKINMIYRGRENIFFYYGETLYVIGDILPDKSKVVNIESDRVLLDKGGKSQWIVVEF